MYEDPLFEQPGVVPLSFVKRVRKASRTEKERAARSLLDSRVYQKWEYEMLKHAHREASSAHTDCEGDEMVKRVSEAMKILDENGFERSSHQRLFHRSFMMASLEQFYREDLQRNLVRLLREYGASELHSEVAIMTPRRFGKTWGVAMWAACMLVTGRDHDTCIYSTGARVSKMMLQTILRMVRVLIEHFGGGIISINKNEEVVFQTNEGYINSICAYPAKSETLRGTGSKRRTGTVILEEAAFIDPAVSLSIVAPTLTRKYVNLFAISTINSEDMVMSSFMTAKYPDGRSVMLSLNFSLVCEACRDAGKADSCQHRMGDLPHWSSVAQHQKLHALMSQAQETLNREIRGIDVSENTKPAFNSGALTALADAELGTVQKLPPQTHVFIVVDPACGGSNSSLALISFVVTGNKVVIVGAEECKSRVSEERQELIARHIHGLQRREEFAGCRMVFCAEANLGSEAQHYGNYLLKHGRHLHNLIIMKEDKEMDGWRTTQTTKKCGYLRCNEMLNERRIKFYSTIFTIEGCPINNMTLRERIVHQLRSFTRIIVPSKQPHVHRNKEIFTGKLSGEDDMAMVLQMALLIYQRYITRKDDYESGSIMQR